ncbi:unnamed protein product [Arabidopsis halleri]
MVGASEALLFHSDEGERVAKRHRSATLLDLDILDCPVCCEALATPIFQCDNGHLACSSCCPKLRNKCPSCAFPVGHNRCRAMESILESTLVPCPNEMFGCTKTCFYGKESAHEKECIFSQCSCPSLNCDYTGSYKDLYAHYELTHSKYSWSIKCGIPYTAVMFISNKILIKRVHESKLLFAVQCFRKPCGVYVTVSCIAPSAPEVGQFSYRLSYTKDGQTVIYESPEVKKVRKVSFETPQENFMLIPHNLLFRSGFLLIELCIVDKLNQE